MSSIPSVFTHPVQQTRAFMILRLVVGTVLLAAAILKARQLLTGPALGDFWWDARPWQAATVGVEVLLAGWMWSGIWPRCTRWLGAGLFAGFSLLTLTKAFAGADSCGCFGAVKINPWITLGLDLSIATAFAIIRPLCASKQTNSKITQAPMTGENHRGVRWTPASVMGIALLSGVGLGIWTGSARPAQLQAQTGELIGDADFVILDPEPWVGHGFPLFDYTDLPDNVRQGNWWVMLYSHTCGHCLETIPKVETKTRNGQAVALISMPPHADPAPTYRVDVQARLNTARDWFAQTPVLIELQEGRVVRAVQGDDADAWF